MEMTRMGGTPMTLLTVTDLVRDSLCALVLLGMSGDIQACMNYCRLLTRVSLKISADSPGPQLRSGPVTGMSSWNTGWQSRAPQTAQWSEHPSARSGGTWNSSWNHSRWERETAARAPPQEMADAEQAPSSSSDSWQMVRADTVAAGSEDPWVRVDPWQPNVQPKWVAPIRSSGTGWTESSQLDTQQIAEPPPTPDYRTPYGVRLPPPFCAFQKKAQGKVDKVIKPQWKKVSSSSS